MDMRYERTEKLIRRAFYALARQTDVNKITVSMLAKEAGINRLSFYLHYENMDRFISQLENEYIQDFIDKMSPFTDFINKPEMIISRMMDFYYQNGSSIFTPSYNRDGYMDKGIDAIIQRIIFESGNDEIIFRQKIIFIINGIKGIFKYNEICDSDTVENLSVFIKSVMES